MAAEARNTISWLVVAAAVIFVGLLAYTLFAGWLPAKQQVARLEAEMKDVYTREAALLTRMAQQDQRSTLRDQQLNALRTERDALAKRVEELERELASLRARRR